MILVGLAITVQAALTRPEYFLADFQLYPAWPRFDAERMRWLFVLAMGVLLVPKAMGVLRALTLSRIRRGCGGALAVVGSAIVEIVVSALYAPVMMMMQTRQVWEILIGFDSGWAPQRRDAAATPWPDVIRRHWFHTVEGAVVAVAVWLLSPELLLWMSPPLLGLLVAMLLSRFSGSVTAGQRLRACRLLLIPEETVPPAVASAQSKLQAHLRQISEDASLQRLIADPDSRAGHFAAVLSLPPPERGRPDADRLTIRAKIGEASGPQEVMSWLTPGERVALVADRTLFELMIDSHKVLSEPARTLRLLP
jgi:membrane glycosyltransferase